MAFSHHEREEKNRLKREKRFKTLLLYEHGNKTESTPFRIRTRMQKENRYKENVTSEDRMGVA